MRKIFNVYRAMIKFLGCIINLGGQKLTKVELFEVMIVNSILPVFIHFHYIWTGFKICIINFFRSTHVFGREPGKD